MLETGSPQSGGSPWFPFQSTQKGVPSTSNQLGYPLPAQMDEPQHGAMYAYNSLGDGGGLSHFGPACNMYPDP